MNRILCSSLLFLGFISLDAAVKEFQCPPKDGQYEDPVQCDKYYECTDGVAKTVICPDGLVFDPLIRKINKCDQPFNVDCGNRTELQPPQSNTLCPRLNGFFAHPDPKVCNIFYNCIYGEGVEIKCKAGLHFDEYSGTCVWPDSAGRPGCAPEKNTHSDGFSCPKDSAVDASGQTVTHPKYPNPTDCQKFYVCLNGVEPRELGCKLGEVYNEEIQRCDAPENVPGCEDWYKDTELPGKEFQCPSKDGQYEDPVQCDKYYECTDGVAKAVICPDGLVFDPLSRKINKCDQPFNVYCGNRTELQPPQSNTLCPRLNGFFAHPDPTVRNIFYTCIQGEGIEINCTAGLHFDESSGTCVRPDSVDAAGKEFQCPPKDGQYEDPVQCDKYYECTDGVAKAVICPDGLVFDPLIRKINAVKCGQPFDIDCGDRTELQPPQNNTHCPRLNGFFAHPDPSVCNIFYNCIQGEAIEIKCSAGLHFSEYSGRCVLPGSARRQGCAPEKQTLNDEFVCPKNSEIDESGQYVAHPKFAHPTDCQKFYVCVNGVISRELGCKIGDVYNEESQRCDAPENVPGCEDWYKDADEKKH